MVDVSIIIVTYNSANDIASCLSSIRSHITNLSYEMIVVDNASTDQTNEAVSQFEDVILIKNAHNIGFAKANNQAVEVSKGRYLMFLNPDVQMTDYCLDNLIQALEDDSTRGIVAPKLLYSDDSIQPSARRFPNLFVQLFGRLPLMKRLFQTQHDLYMMKDWDYGTDREVDWVIGAAMLCNKTLYNRIGGFDESFFLYCEDIDLCYRFVRQGYSIYYLSSTVLIHDYQQASSRKLSKLTMLHFRSLFTFYRKHPTFIFRKIGGGRHVYDSKQSREL